MEVSCSEARLFPRQCRDGSENLDPSGKEEVVVQHVLVRVIPVVG